LRVSKATASNYIFDSWRAGNWSRMRCGAHPLPQRPKGIRLAVEFIDSPSLNADPERIFRVLSNLLGNAIKFTPERGTITVRVERRGDDLSIAVADTGPGIAADQLPHVFERYWKARQRRRLDQGWGSTLREGSSRPTVGRCGPSPPRLAPDSPSRYRSRADQPADFGLDLHSAWLRWLFLTRCRATSVRPKTALF
jgi:hypothetical protein